MGLAETAELAVNLNMKGNFAQGVKQAQGALGGLQSTFNKVGAVMERPNIKGFMQGAGLSQFAGFGAGQAGLLAGQAFGALTDAIGGSIDAAREWESAFAGVKKTVDTTGLSIEQESQFFEELEGQLRGLSKEIPITSTELAALAEAGGALGIATEHLTEFARVTALIGTTTDVAAEDAATALGKIGTVIGLTNDEYERFGSTLVALGNAGASTESEIIALANRMSGAAAQVGVSASEMLGWASAMASVGIEAEAGGSAFMRFADATQTAVLLGTAKLDLLADTAGMTKDAFRELWSQSSSSALEAVIVGLGRLSGAERIVRQEALQLSGEIRLKTFIDKLASGSDFLTASLNLQESAWRDNTAMAVEAQKRFETFDSKMQLFNNTINDVGIQIGEILLPHLTNAVDLVNDLLTGPTLKQQAFKDWAKGLGGAVEEAVGDMQEAQKGAGLGTYEDLYADTPLGLINPRFAEQVKFWREFHEEFEQAGIDFYTFRDGLNAIEAQMGVAGPEALEVARSYLVLDKNVTEATEAINAMKSSLGGAIRGFFAMPVALGAATDATEELEKAEKQATQKAKRLQSAIESVAGSIRKDIVDASKDSVKSIREMFKDQHRPLVALAKEEAKLARLRKRALSESRFDIAATIDQRLEEIATIDKDRRLNIRFYREQRDDLKSNKREIEDVQKVAKNGAKLLVKVDDSELDALEARFRALDNGVIIPIRTSRVGPTGTSFGTSTARPTTVVRTAVPAYTVAGATTRVTSSNRKVFD